ncbi:MAG: mannose-1-phosphate guanylyltransferase/mannose-6-phosphate isomerase [Hyphomicrobiaceae bacterium]
MATTIIPVIMCGGAGTRLWPASREAQPKQFMTLLGGHSTFEATLDRVRPGDLFEKAIVITNDDFRFVVAEQARRMGADVEIVLEPMRQDSAPAVAVAAELAFQRSSDAIVLILAADHVVRDPDGFRAASRKALAAAEAGRIVTFGITPEGPVTSYGYIRPSKKPVSGEVKAVEAFVEKPDAETAAVYLRDGYLWNSGNFLFRAATMREELKRLDARTADAARSAVKLAKRDLDFLRLDKEAFAAARKISIDYAVMEKTDKAAVLEASFGWSDVGSWDAVWQIAAKDADGNATRGDVVTEGARDNLVESETGILTALIGVEGLAVIVTGDAVLVAARERSEGVKALVDRLKKAGRREVSEHRRVYRPWGYYQSIDMGERYQVKRIVVKPGGRLSLQKHFHRSEHWVVVKGTAEVTADERVVAVRENESISLPLGTVHRLANPGKIPLELIEVQVGSYLGEDDIVRIEDVYGRKG